MSGAAAVTVSNKQPLPRGWRWAQLGEMAEYHNGRAFKPDEWSTSGLPIIRIQNLTSADAPFNYFTGEVAPENRVTDGDLLISWSASLDAYIWNRGPAVLNQHIFKVEERREIIRREYLYYVVRNVMDQIRAQVHGATMHITKPEFQAIEIPLPPLSTQDSIVTQLQVQTAAVARAGAAAEAELEAACTLASAYLRAIFTSPEAERWPNVRLDDLAETCSGTTPPRGRHDYYGGDVPWVKTAELKDGFIDATDEYVTEPALRETSLRILPPGTLLVAMYGQGQTRGRTGLLRVPATTNQACFAILPNPQFNPLFLQLWFRHNYSRLRLESEGRGGNQPNLNGDVLRSQLIGMPELPTQQKLVAILTQQLGAAQQVRTLINDQLRTIQLAPAALLRRAFNGEL